MKKKGKKRKSSAKRGSRTWAYPVEFRLRIVKLYLEEEYSVSLFAEQFRISRSAIRRWVRSYRQRGIEGLEVKPRAGGNSRVTSSFYRDSTSLLIRGNSGPRAPAGYSPR
jgi:transposase-like protein